MTTREPELINIEKIKNKTQSKSQSQSKSNESSKNLYEKLLANLKEKVSVIEIRTSTIHLLIKYVMEQVEETPVKGLEQKELGLKLIRHLIIDLTENEDEKVMLQLLDDGTVGNLIDLISDATKGKLNINTIVDVSTGCINSCVPYCFSKKK